MMLVDEQSATALPFRDCTQIAQLFCPGIFSLRREGLSAGGHHIMDLFAAAGRLDRHTA
jgi:hypothetical protein